PGRAIQLLADPARGAGAVRGPEQLAVQVRAIDRQEQCDAVSARGGVTADSLEPLSHVAGLGVDEIRPVVEIAAPRPLLDRPSFEAAADPQFEALEALSLEVDHNLAGDDPAFLGADTASIDLFSCRQELVARGHRHAARVG